MVGGPRPGRRPGGSDLVQREPVARRLALESRQL